MLEQTIQIMRHEKGKKSGGNRIFASQQQIANTETKPMTARNALTKHSLRVGWRIFFSSCAVVSVFGSGGKQVLVVHTTYVLRVQYSCGVVLVFWFWREIVFGVMYILSVLQTVVRLCQFFYCGGKVNFVQKPYSHDHFSKILRTFFVKKLIPDKTYEREQKLIQKSLSLSD